MIRVIGTQLKRSLLMTLQYRVELVVQVFMSLFWTVNALVPLFVLFGQRKTVAGWTWPEALLVVGCFTILKGFLNGVVQPSLQTVVELIRKGTFDFLLLKPIDSQLLVSTSNFQLWQTADVVAGGVVSGYALHTLGRVPSLLQWATFLALIMCGGLILYAIWIIVVSLAFRFVKIDNLSYLFMSIFDAARWPASVFRGAFAFFFSFIIPLALMTTYPALALLGRMDVRTALTSVVVTCVFLVIARLSWMGSLRHYSSAGG